MNIAQALKQKNRIVGEMNMPYIPETDNDTEHPVYLGTKIQNVVNKT